MSWADCMPPDMPSVDMPDVPPWEREPDIASEDAWFEYGREGELYDDPRLDCPWKCPVNAPHCLCAKGKPTEQTEPDDFDVTRLAGALT